MAESLPATPGPRDITIRFASNSVAYSSPITGATQRAHRYGGRWQLEYTMPPLSRHQAGAWMGLLTKLNGPATTVYAGPWAKKTIDHYDADARLGSPYSPSLILDFQADEYCKRWITAPTVLVNGASQTGSTLAVDGWETENGLNAGDYISFDNGTFRELHIVTADCWANSSGEMTIPVAPNIRRSPSDNAAVTFENATGEFVLAAPDEAAEEFSASNGHREITVRFIEAMS